MKKDSSKGLGQVIQIDEGQVRGHLDEMVRSTVEETLNGLLDAEADRLCNPISQRSCRLNAIRR